MLWSWAEEEPDLRMICHFSIIYVHLFFLLIQFHCAFPYLKKYYNFLFIIIIFWLGCVIPSGLLPFSCLLCFFLYPRLPSYLLRMFFILFRSCCSHARVFGKHSRLSFPCPIAILNGTFLFSPGEIVYLGRSFVYQNLIKLTNLYRLTTIAEYFNWCVYNSLFLLHYGN